jgi:hypothetical protein
MYALKKYHDEAGDVKIGREYHDTTCMVVGEVMTDIVQKSSGNSQKKNNRQSVEATQYIIKWWGCTSKTDLVTCKNKKNTDLNA